MRKTIDINNISIRDSVDGAAKLAKELRQYENLRGQFQIMDIMEGIAERVARAYDDRISVEPYVSGMQDRVFSQYGSWSIVNYESAPDCNNWVKTHLFEKSGQRLIPHISHVIDAFAVLFHKIVVDIKVAQELEKYKRDGEVVYSPDSDIMKDKQIRRAAKKIDRKSSPLTGIFPDIIRFLGGRY